MQILPYNTESHLNSILHFCNSDAFVQADMHKCLKEHPDCAWVVEKEGRLIAVAVYSGRRKKTSYTLFVDLAHRRQGVGSQLLKYLEEDMRANGVVEAVCDYKTDPVIEAFVDHYGYGRWFKSCHMTFENHRFEGLEAQLSERNLTVVPYEDGLYTPVQCIFSEAFHGMRLALGLPSTLSLPSEEDRADFLENAENVFVLLDNAAPVAVLRLENHEVDAIAVDPLKQNQGYGKMLAQIAVNTLKDRGHERPTLWVVEGNPARFLYESIGFKALRIHQFDCKELNTQ